ncbi:MAG: 50S ribosomal protein L29 [Candidatus Diapherotrites archaeon]|uniref:Large ribosomal subunit protein uL29 n=1 Tax=Candidatus Iainarchaeum sp. TaxID=3101447 RepID=A0A8T4L425_9ARCH|nr:50S ribosomal protein L29 [Candidatus Diapherotrites archaeon]
MKVKEVRALGDQDAETKLAELKKQLAKERGLVASGTRPENPGKIKDMRKTIARILTVSHEKALKQKTKKMIARGG